MSLSQSQDVVDSTSSSGMQVSADDLNSSPQKKKVWFNEEKLVDVKIFKFTKEDAELRKPFWEVFARDRLRFHDRIQELADMLGGILQQKHREKVYEKCFPTVVVLFLNSSDDDDEV